MKVITITLAPWHVALGWAAFGNLAAMLRRSGLAVDRLEYRRHFEEFGGVSTTFEILETP